MVTPLVHSHAQYNCTQQDSHEALCNVRQSCICQSGMAERQQQLCRTCAFTKMDCLKLNLVFASLCSNCMQETGSSAYRTPYIPAVHGCAVNSVQSCCCKDVQNIIQTMCGACCLEQKDSLDGCTVCCTVSTFAVLNCDERSM